MSKRSGMGMRFYVGGFDLSDDTGSFSRIGGGVAGTQDVTPVSKSAFERLGLLRQGSVEYMTFFNDDTGRSHPRHKLLPTADVIATGTIGTAIGSPAFSMVGKQLNYDPTRPADGSLTFAVNEPSSGYGLEWGDLLTAAARTDTGATLGASLDLAASTAFGLQAYLQVTAITGTDATVKIQESSDDGVGDAFADVVGGAFAQVTAAGIAERIETARALTVERYLRVVTTTVGGFTSLSFVVMVVKNPVAVVF